jgi:maltose alpha-D-glucosyltransferase/alpha-amylase
MEAACALGLRTAELHMALCAETEDPAFSPEPLNHADVDAIVRRTRETAAKAFDLLKASLSGLPDDLLEMASIVLSRRRQLTDRLLLSSSDSVYGKRIRIHGDYHLGQVLRSRNDFVIIDFEGEPASPFSLRRLKSTPLKDVAGMLRSFSYVANSTLLAYVARHPEGVATLEPWARLWEQTVSAEFLKSYRGTAATGGFLPAAEKDVSKLLDACLIEKAMYELTYELNNRPTWIRIPLAGILALGS